MKCALKGNGEDNIDGVLNIVMFFWFRQICKNCRCKGLLDFFLLALLPIEKGTILPVELLVEKCLFDETLVYSRFILPLKWTVRLVLLLL